MYVTNFLPAQRADLDYVAACVSVIEMDGFTKVKDIQLANPLYHSVLYQS